MSERIYKVVSRSQWRRAEAEGVFHGAEIDLRDGFIHLSAANQLAETLRLHFAGQNDLLLVSVDPAQLADTLKWEPSRGGELFPHLYGDLPMSAVTDVHDLPWIDSEHRLPDWFTA